MRDALKTVLGKTIMLEDGSKFQYSIMQAELQNVLGATAAIVDEYTITDKEGSVYKLYKTKEGNWYDIPEQNKAVNTSILQQLKRTIDAQKKDTITNQ